MRCTGKYKLGNNTWHCHSRRGHGGVNLHTAIPKSCDVYFYAFGRQIGIDPIAVMARRLGLGQKYELPLPGIDSSAGFWQKCSVSLAGILGTGSVLMMALIFSRAGRGAPS